MSLLSQQDREITIAALENYIAAIKTSGNPKHQLNQVNTLLNWIKLEHTKNK